ncbi:MAG: riboflavin synthase [Steroidobacteraceae bacterium]
MFTGIVQDLGYIAQSQWIGGDVRLRIDTDIAAERRALGDSVAVNGVCLTVAQLAPRGFFADVSRETLDVTTLSDLAVGTRVNLEPALRAGDALGGHIVSGHVDGIAHVLELHDDARSTRVRMATPAALRRYIAAKGSVTLDGVSLTVNQIDEHSFGINLIPHTLQVTTLGALRIGSRLNIEIDTLARYVDRMLAARAGDKPM